MLLKITHHDYLAGYVANQHIDWTDPLANQNINLGTDQYLYFGDSQEASIAWDAVNNYLNISGVTNFADNVTVFTLYTTNGIYSPANTGTYIYWGNGYDIYFICTDYLANAIHMIHAYAAGDDKSFSYLKFNETMDDVNISFGTTIRENLLFIDAGLDKVYFGDGGVTNYAEFGATGNLSLLGSAVLDWSNQPSKPKVYSQIAEPTLPNDTMAFWVDTDDLNRNYLILNVAGVQKKVELT